MSITGLRHSTPLCCKTSELFRTGQPCEEGADVDPQCPEEVQLSQVTFLSLEVQTGEVPEKIALG